MTADDDTIQAALDSAKDRYRLEREKRLRTDGLAQYSELKGEFADFDRDPYVEPGFAREPIKEDTDVVIVGGGFAGMLTAIDLTRNGIRNFRLIEKAGDFGGTWYWNRYPGCMCDVESMTYLPLLEETGYRPTERYASAPEIFGYCQLLGRHFDLYPHALFQTEIDEPVWDNDAKRWTITTTRGDELSSRFFVTAGGILHKAKLPGIPGINDFQGRAFHTSRWDYTFTGGGPREPMEELRNMRVGIIGTGATAVQAVPRLAETAKELYVFQRTPSAVGVRNNGPVDPAWFDTLEPGWHDERVRNFTHAVTGVQPERDLVSDGWTKVMWVNAQEPTEDPEKIEELEREDFEMMQDMRDRIDEIVDDPVTADRLKPWYGKHCKRICFHDEYLPAFNQPNVHLVDTNGRGVEQITESGVVVDGEEYPLDLLIFASGFEVTTDLDQRLGFDPKGRDGISLSERWSDGAHSLHGILSGEFPNMMMISLVQAGFGTNFLHFLAQSAQHVAWLIKECLEQGISEIEATPEAEEEWLGVLYTVVGGIARYSQTCTPGYYNSEGQRTAKAARNLVYAGSLLDYSEYLVQWRNAGDFAGTKISRR
ncbi:MAG: NAD(P)/FAD-dependent oxidoreductase [Acidimicrobiales bacterium]|nr:NAD(P)/FAD-dependent oxidoreductase [Acidimicrobiales bacterium]MDG2217544.1 NAD(P)/FAD-dependent oxidoreductase [Acidimicrobiales bacterium]